MAEVYTHCTGCEIRCWSTPGARCACGGRRVVAGPARDWFCSWCGAWSPADTTECAVCGADRPHPPQEGPKKGAELRTDGQPPQKSSL